MTSNCPLCNSTNTSILQDRVRFGYKACVMHCDKCSLTYLAQNSFKFPEDFYETQYHQTYLTHIEPDALDAEKYFNKMLKVSKPWSDKLKKMLKGDESILDVGCSTGHFMFNLKESVREIYGSELSKKEVEFCRAALGLDVSAEPLEMRFPQKRFDYITLIFVLEHIANPVYFLKYLKSFLKPDGRIIIVVPNINDPLMSLYDLKKFSEFYFCIEHLFYYSPDTISMVFENAGLKGHIEIIQEYPLTNHLNWNFFMKPSDSLKSRSYIPDIPLKSGKHEKDWDLFWDATNTLYKEFLIKNRLGDRIWCAVGESND